MTLRIEFTVPQAKAIVVGAPRATEMRRVVKGVAKILPA
jgi:hypothetical protein